MQRYHRQNLVSEVSDVVQNKIKNTPISVIGCGGLGSPLLLYLAGAGFENIQLIDFDTVDLSNLHRQVLYKENQIGQPKAESAKQNLLQLNSNLKLKIQDQSLTLKNCHDILKDSQIIIEGSDNFSTKYLINDYCQIQNKTLVMGSVRKWQGQILISHKNQKGCYRCLFENPSQNQIPNCSTEGIIGMIPGIVGTYMALEVIKTLCDIQNKNTFLNLNLKTNQIQNFDWQPNPNCQICVKQKTLEDLQQDYQNGFCQNQNEFKDLILSVEDIQNEDFTKIDVTEKNETPMIPCDIKIPLSAFKEQVSKMNFSKNKKHLLALFESLKEIQKKYNLLLILDEFQDVSFVKEAEALWRGALQTLTKSSVFILGSKRHILQKIFDNTNSPLFQFGDEIHLEPIALEDWHKYFKERLEPKKLKIEKDDLAYLLKIMCDVPNSICELGAYLVEKHFRKKLTKSVIQNSLNDMIQTRQSYAYRRQFLTQIEIRILSRLAKGPYIKSPQSQEFLAKLKISKSTVSYTIQKLLDKGLIEFELEKGYRVSDPVFGYYLAFYES